MDDKKLIKGKEEKEEKEDTTDSEEKVTSKMSLEEKEIDER